MKESVRQAKAKKKGLTRGRVRTEVDRRRGRGKKP